MTERALMDGESDGQDGGTMVRTRRKMEVVFAPHLSQASCEFVTVREGVLVVVVEAQR